jgi:hypothetical protein
MCSPITSSLLAALAPSMSRDGTALSTVRCVGSNRLTPGCLNADGRGRAQHTILSDRTLFAIGVMLQ